MIVGDAIIESRMMIVDAAHTAVSARARRRRLLSRRGCRLISAPAVGSGRLARLAASNDSYRGGQNSKKARRTRSITKLRTLNLPWSRRVRLLTMYLPFTCCDTPCWTVTDPIRTYAR